MLNNQLNNWQLNTNIAPILWGISSWVVEWSLWQDVVFDKYSFIEIIEWIEIQTITLADFLSDWNLWIYVIENNFRETPTKEFQQYNNPFSDWWQILSSKYTRKEISMTLWIITNWIVSLEATLSNLKSVFDSWWKLQFNHNWILRTIKVEIDELSVNNIRWYRAEMNLKFLSVSPFFESIENVKVSTGLSWNSQIGLGLFNTERNLYVDINLIIAEITWNIDGASVTYNWFSVTYNWILVSWDVLEFNWRTKKVLLNDVEVPKYSWQFTEIEKNKQTPIDVSFSWWWTVDNYNIYTLYNNLFL